MCLADEAWRWGPIGLVYQWRAEIMLSLLWERAKPLAYHHIPYTTIVQKRSYAHKQQLTEGVALPPNPGGGIKHLDIQ